MASSPTSTRIRLSGHPNKYALSRVLPVVGFAAIAVVWFAYSPTRIFAAHPRYFSWMVGFLVSKLTLHLMLAHICGSPFHPLRRSLMPFFFLALHCGVSRFLEPDAMVPISGATEKALLVELFLLATCAYAHAVLNIAWETAQALNRRIFSIADVLAKRKS